MAKIRDYESYDGTEGSAERVTKRTDFSHVRHSSRRGIAQAIKAHARIDILVPPVTPPDNYVELLTEDIPREFAHDKWMDLVHAAAAELIAQLQMNEPGDQSADLGTDGFAFDNFGEVI